MVYFRIPYPLEIPTLVFTIKSVANPTGNERFYRHSINTCYPFGTCRAMVKIMDEIEAGLKKLEQKIEELKAAGKRRYSFTGDQGP